MGQGASARGRGRVKGVGGGAAVDVTDGSEEVLEPAPADDGGAVGVACGVIVAPLSEWTAAAVL